MIDQPHRAGRQAILEVHLKKIQAASTVRSSDVAGLTTGFSGADLANLINEAALIATRRGAEAVELLDFTQASAKDGDQPSQTLCFDQCDLRGRQ